MLRSSSLRISAALVVVFVTFLVFGLPDGILGTVWPTQRADLGLAVGDLSWVITGITVGYMAGSVVSGHLAERIGTSPSMLAAFATSFVGLVGFGLAPNLGALTAISVIAGAGAGLLDPIVNAWVALRHSARAMGFLHAFFGVGAAIGPPFATTAINNGVSWRGVFIIVGVAELSLMAAVWLRRHDFDAELPHDSRESPAGQQPSSRLLLSLTLVWFFLIVGFEVSVGSWGFSLLVEQRGVVEATAALWVAAFWGTFTLGRFAMGLVGDRLRLEPALWSSVALCAAGAVLLWAAPDALPAGLSLPLLGLGVSLLFPVMVLLTPRWLGAERAGVATGYQFGAASVGAVAFSIAIGTLADSRSLEVLGPVLLIGAVAMAVTLAAMRSVASRAAI